MQASEIMTAHVVTVRPETELCEVARLLLAHGISAVPVVDEAGGVLGMVSEGDLIGRDDAAREARRDWWLTLLAEGEALHPDFLATLRAHARTARDAMQGPVVAVGETTDAREIAQLLITHHIKRVPVLRDGRIVGIVSRADLLRAFAHAPAEAERQKPRSELLGLVEGALAKLDARFLHGEVATRPEPPAGDAAAEPDITATSLRSLVAGFEEETAERRAATARATMEHRREAVKALIDDHVGDQPWRAMLHGAHEAAERGAKEFMLLRFPSELCSDGGRAINAPLPDWPKTLRGEAAEIYLRWERDLRPRGFHLSARVLDFPDGKPGDIGLFLAWGA
jgi:CBS domain-containing protein